MVPSADADTVLRARMAAVTSSDCRRERIFRLMGLICLMIFARAVLFAIFSLGSEFFAASHAHFGRSRKIVGVRGTQLEMASG